MSSIVIDLMLSIIKLIYSLKITKSMCNLPRFYSKICTSIYLTNRFVLIRFFYFFSGIYYRSSLIIILFKVIFSYFNPDCFVLLVLALDQWSFRSTD